MFTRDLLERAVRTFIQTAVAVFVAGWAGDFSTPALRTAALSGLAAGVSAVMSLLAKPVGDPESASVL